MATAGTAKTLETLTPDETSTAVCTAAIAVIIATPRIPETSTTVRNIKSSRTTGSTREDWSIRLANSRSTTIAEAHHDDSRAATPAGKLAKAELLASVGTPNCRSQATLQIRRPQILSF